MKKKVLLATVALFVLIAGVVSAASIWGTYKGNDIIRLTVNGDPVKVSDVPVISYNNRTMIPIYLLQQAGIGYTWDQKNKTVDIKQNTSGNNSNDTKKIKGYFKVTDMYKRTDALGSQITGLSTTFNLAYNTIRDNSNVVPLSEALERLNNVINNYNSQANYIDSTILELRNYGIYIDLSDVTRKYYDAIDYYKASYTYLERYSSTFSKSDFNNYLSNSNDGFDNAFNGRVLCENNYQKYRDIILNYNP